MTVSVRFLPVDISVDVRKGQTILDAAIQAGIHLNASCGGAGVCGKCRIILDEGEVESPKTQFISDSEYAAGVRQACISTVQSNVTVHLPPEAALDSKTLNLLATSKNAYRTIQDFGLAKLIEENRLNPPTQKLRVKVTPPSIQDQSSDVSRLLRALAEQHNVHNVLVDIEVIRKLPQTLRKNDFEVTAVVAFAPRLEHQRVHLVSVESGDRSDHNYHVAVDVGTTTVWGALMNVTTGEVMAEHGEYNSQIGYGEDVISRINYASRPGGLQKMQELVVSNINSIIEVLLRKSKVSIHDITRINLAGNTTMTQLLLGVDPQYIRLRPYVPTANYFPPVRAANLGIGVPRDVLAVVFPAIASYVGGDIVSGVVGSGVHRSEKLTLFIDLGTNGEIVVGNKDWMVCAACSAGPAFEGGGIKHGMRASLGAIEEILIHPQTYEPMLVTVGKSKPRGICGSGLINTVAAMLRTGIINEKGKFDPDLPTDRIRKNDVCFEFVLASGQNTQTGEDIVLTEIDIDNLIRAKGAMFAGYLTLLEGVGLTMEDLEQVVIAGGFGYHINLENAITIGLLPELDLDRFVFVGNGALLGAKMASLSNEVRIDVKETVSRITNFELSETPRYMDHYVASMFLPHTEQKYFPKVYKMLGERPQTAHVQP
ncbi:MAG: DUF4445 domain-containing protein [Deltaproteobacteria bacterium]|nr:DUF4445 domain-containing protein [Deltaproteobacteria bacterium]